jgi:hypothetical protein
MAASSSPARHLALATAVAALTVVVAPARADDAADLVLTAAPVAQSAAVGDRINYVLDATNRGAATAEDVRLVGSLAGPGEVASAETGRGDCAVVDGTATCALGSLAPGERAEATIAAETTGPGTITARFGLGPSATTITLRTAVGSTARPTSLPAAGPLVWPSVVARAAPRPDASPLLVFHQLRRDLLPQIVFALGAQTDAQGRVWYRVELPMRPNGRHGWVRAEALALEPVRREILIDRSARLLRVLEGGHVILQTRVAVGRPGMETPLGDFYVTAEFKPTEPILGAFAIETSAYSRLTEWPGGGIVGIHGTPEPWLLGRAVSHGCVRVSNTAILRLARLVPPGSPVRIMR